MGVKIKSKKHWFAFAFTGKQEACGTPCDASLYIGYPDKKITLGRIQACKTDAGVTQEAAMISYD